MRREKVSEITNYKGLIFLLLNSLNLKRYLKIRNLLKELKKELKGASFGSVALPNKKGMGYQRTTVR
jgi:hypothetical protein